MCFLSLIISDRVFHYRLRARCKQASPTRPVHELGISLGPYLGHNRLEESSVYNIVSTTLGLSTGPVYLLFRSVSWTRNGKQNEILLRLRNEMADANGIGFVCETERLMQIDSVVSLIFVCI
jgi:hypothetical protein